jgi:hypothetical protein
MEPLGAERYKVQFTADQVSYEQLQELRALMRHQVPDGDIGKIVGKAISVLLEQVRKQKFASLISSLRGFREHPRDTFLLRSAAPSRSAAAALHLCLSGGQRCDSNEFLGLITPKLDLDEKPLRWGHHLACQP